MTDSTFITFPIYEILTPYMYIRGFSVHRGDNISTVGKIASVLWMLFSTVGDSFSTVGDSFSTVEVVQYSGG